MIALTERQQALVSLAIGLATVALAERFAARALGSPPAAADTAFRRAANVQQLSRNPADGTVVKHPFVMVIGNSHTYALPGLTVGDSLRSSGGAVVIDNLAALAADQDADFALLAYPNFLPFEMLSRVAHLAYRGIHPDAVLIGITYRNVARDSQLRAEIHTEFRDPAFTEAFRRDIVATGGPDADLLQAAIASEQAKSTFEAAAQRTRSDADQLDDRLVTWLGQQMDLAGRSADLRGMFYRTFTRQVQNRWSAQTDGYDYDQVAADYRFNMASLQTMIRLLQHRGARVLCYYAPERSDLKPIMDPAGAAAFRTRFEQWAAEQSVSVVNAASVVPNEFWGWDGNVPDRSHFTEPGHQRLAQFLFDAITRTRLLAREPTPR